MSVFGILAFQSMIYILSLRLGLFTTIKTWFPFPSMLSAQPCSQFYLSCHTVLQDCCTLRDHGKANRASASLQYGSAKQGCT